MILPALIDYYRRLEQDDERNVPEFGFSREGISYCVVLEPDGVLAGDRLEDLREEVITNEKTGKTRLVSRKMLVPNRGGRSGTKIKPFFLRDNTGYALGRDAKGDPKRAEQAFQAFKGFHLSFREQIDEDDYEAVCRFLEAWEPERAEALVNWEEASGQNVVFRVRGWERFVHQSDAVRRMWREVAAGEAESDRNVSLVSGEEEEVARLHPLIQGVAGTNTMGAAVASFNSDAFTSYGKTQSYNAPVGLHDAFRYTTSLEELLDHYDHRTRIGDATVVFWSDRPTPFESMFGSMFSTKAEDSETNAKVQSFLNALRQGRPHESVGDAAVPFYILGLSPNASRISVRFWLAGTVKQFADRLAQHAADLEMGYEPPDAPPLMIRRLLLETAREPKDIPPQLAGEVARAVLTGGHYPQTLLSAIIRRIRADRVLNHRRAAILKAVLVRHARLAGHDKMEVPVSLNTTHPEPAYHLGRLFAALEKTQEDALGGHLNKTIRDSYFGTASATPSAVFPRLMRLHQHHIEKMEGGLKVNREKLIQEICSHVQQFPPHLPLTEQGLFHIAYYHQRSDFFTKKNGDVSSTATTETETTR